MEFRGTGSLLRGGNTGLLTLTKEPVTQIFGAFPSPGSHTPHALTHQVGHPLSGLKGRCSAQYSELTGAITWWVPEMSRDHRFNSRTDESHDSQSTVSGTHRQARKPHELGLCTLAHLWPLVHVSLSCAAALGGRQITAF